ncbi:MAG TPA: undecaprenyldiphospho-muramoylpentapeptide beta-N-acetylglucosaminyltransferase [Acidimicrobiales bacterium]|nr:undecaprenyldiphospho-muramoylpentapeptide beta-N-acetylglucosaminyltransferase [Acidimicrobiales bacterium]
MTPRSGPAWAVVAGGGTGGHVVPAIAIGQALTGRGHPADAIRFVGSERGLEARMVPAAGFEVTLLPGRGIARRFSKENVGAVIGLLRAFGSALALMRRLRPAVVVSVGGYASAPAALAAVLWRVPLVVAEQNAVPGLANRLAGRFAAACAVSFEGTPLPRAVVTGNPVRPEVVMADTSPEGRAAARAALGLPPDAVVVAVAGGSLGARRINTAVVELAGRWAGRSGVCIRHVVGRRDYTEMVGRRPAPVPGGLGYDQIEFEDRMDLLLTAADVTVQRAGASTVAELAVIGVASILVPLPGAPGDHQTQNARRLADAGAAVLVPDAELDTDRLERELGRLVDDRADRQRMAEAARRLGRPDAAERVATLVEQHARG